MKNRIALYHISLTRMMHSEKPEKRGGTASGHEFQQERPAEPAREVPMECPECGYMMDAFETDCPRCARRRQQPAAGDTPPAAPVLDRVKNTVEGLSTSFELFSCWRAVLQFLNRFIRIDEPELGCALTLVLWLVSGLNILLAFVYQFGGSGNMICMTAIPRAIGSIVLLQGYRWALYLFMLGSVASTVLTLAMTPSDEIFDLPLVVAPAVIVLLTALPQWRKLR